MLSPVCPGVCRLRWRSGQAYDGLYDAAPTSVNATQFVRVHDGDLVIDCKRCAAAAGPSWAEDSLYHGKLH